MRGNEKVLAALNEALAEELTALSQYFLHAEMSRHWGYLRLYPAWKKISVQEMKHAEELIERILFLEGEPNMTPPLKLRVGKDTQGALESDLALELEAVAMYNRAVRLAEEAGDNGTRELFEKLLAEEEGHADWLEKQLHQIGEIGYERYLAEQMHSEQ